LAKNRNTVEFLGIWEKIHNPSFNYGEFAIIRSQAGLNSYKISVKEWVKKTNEIGLKATTGRYGGTYAHKDITFEFGMWISPEFIIIAIGVNTVSFSFVNLRLVAVKINGKLRINVV
jgi:hypothetical protein